MRKKICIANWKLNPETPKEALALFKATQSAIAKVKEVEVVVCPPALFLADISRVRGVSRKIALGTQDAFFENGGAYTGELSPRTAHAYKAQYAIVGHSERRSLGESNAVVGKKVRAVLKEGLIAVLCVGETERNDEGAFYTQIREELEEVLLGITKKELSRLIIAYEPVWAIGKSAENAMHTRDLHEMVLFIRKVCIEKFGKKPAEEIAILYGGSVKKENAHNLLVGGGIDGFLIGSASLDAQEFGEIVKTKGE